MASTIQFFAEENYKGATVSYNDDVEDITKDIGGVGAKSCHVTGSEKWSVYSEAYFKGTSSTLVNGDYPTCGDMGMPPKGAMSAKPKHWLQRTNNVFAW